MKRLLIIFVLVSIVQCFVAPAQISVKFNADTTYVCEGYPLQFNDESTGFNIIKWMWDFGDSNTDTVQNPIHAYSTAGTYTVTLTASSLYLNDTTVGTLSKTNYIVVRKIPVPDFTYTDTLFLPSYLYYFRSVVTNSDNLSYSYFWSFEENQFEQGDSVAIHTFTNNNSYSIGLIVESGAGCQDTVIKTIQVEDITEAPNVFSPNGDGHNDVFVVKTNGSNLFLLEVFNRWGAIVYSITAKRLQWDGRSSSGAILPPGPYFYHITSPDVKGYDISGFVQLVK